MIVDKINRRLSAAERDTVSTWLTTIGLAECFMAT